VLLRAFLFALTMEDKIKIGISSCLLGNNVRYDGGNRGEVYLRDTLGQIAEWVPVCPEVESGLTVPREAMHLIGDRDIPRLVTILTGIDHTERLTHWSRGKILELSQLNLCGFVFKARSPSCGVRDAAIIIPSGSTVGKGTGLFTAAIMRYFPALPIEDEEGLRDAAPRQDFMKRVFAYQRH
jgi:uncharacterized protein YbbK (DUF523 family)